MRAFWVKLAGPAVLLATVFISASCSSLPDTRGRSVSLALREPPDGSVARLAHRFTASHPGVSGVHALAWSPDALAARLALAEQARRSLDVQYYIWHNDTTGGLLVSRLLQAADRGVRVRVLLDDLGTRASDDGLLVLDAHPNIEVRLFNPVAMRSARMLGALLDFRRVNRRMHNKAFIADNRAAIVGGRNIGDEYFGASQEMNFADLDVVAVGPVVGGVSRQFDAYWNSPSSIGIGTLASGHTSSVDASGRRLAFEAMSSKAESSPVMEAARSCPVAAGIQKGSLELLPCRAWAVYDEPDKVHASASDPATHLAPKLRSVLDQTHRRLFIVSPYFIPEKHGVELLESLQARGVQVVVLTNSLASTDVAAVHSGYKRCRKPLLRAGVQIHELKPEQRRGAGGGSASTFGGSSKAGLHAKTFTFDDGAIFVGSMNLDPRSLRLNTEVGLVIECPELASRLTRTVLQDIDRHAYRLELQRGRLEWSTREGGRTLRFSTEPQTTAWQRLKVALLGLLPIEGQL